MADIVMPLRYEKEPVGARVWLPNFSEQAYHSDKEAVSAGGIKNLVGDKTPAHFRHEWSQPYDPNSSTPILRLGTLVHLAVWERDRFATRVVQPSFGDLRFKENKARKAEWFASLPDDMVETSVDAESGKTERTVKPGALILTPHEDRQVQEMAAEVITHPEVREMMNDGAIFEATVYWRDEETGIWCRARPDCVSPALRIIGDLKTCEDAGDEAFSRSIHNNLYHIQVAHYLDAAEAVTGDPWVWKFIPLERNPPYLCRVIQLHDEAVVHGRQLRRQALRKLADCLASGKWPGYGERANPINLPPYAYRGAPDLPEGF